jgi:Lrp/AsnC family leucine-responsive transcriptional regulator
MAMDQFDRNILDLLQKNGRLSTTELAEQIGLSQSPCARRLKRLESSGVISGYKASVERKSVGLDMTIFVNVRLNQHKEAVINEFERLMIELPMVLCCHIISGSYDYLLEVVCPDLNGYELFIRRLQSHAAVQDISSNFAIRTVKNYTPLPLCGSRASI